MIHFLRLPLHLKPCQSQLQPGSKAKIGFLSAWFQTSFRAKNLNNCTTSLIPQTHLVCLPLSSYSTVNYGMLCWSHEGVPAQGYWNPGRQTPRKSKVRTANLMMSLAPDTYLREQQAEGGTAFLILCTCEIWQCQAPAPSHCSQQWISARAASSREARVGRSQSETEIGQTKKLYFPAWI